jgi:outer membrane murein-binding lipoprotein Lpp
MPVVVVAVVVAVVVVADCWCQPDVAQCSSR